MGRKSIANGDAPTLKGRISHARPTKRTSGGVAMDFSHSREGSPSVAEPSKKRKQVTLTLTTDPEEEMVAKKIKREVYVAKFPGDKTNDFPFHEKPSATRRHSLDSSRLPLNRSSSKKIKKPSAHSRRSVELTICLSPEVEFTFSAAGRSSTGSRRRRKSSTSTTSVSNRAESFVEYSRVKTESVVDDNDKTLDLELTPTVEEKLFANLDDNDDFQKNRKESVEATAASVAKKRKGRKPSVRKERIDRDGAPASGGRRSGRKKASSVSAFDGNGNILSVTNSIEPFHRMDQHQRQQQQRQSYEFVPSKTESSLFSWSSNSLSPIQDNDDDDDGGGAGGTFAYVPPTIDAPTRNFLPRSSFHPAAASSSSSSTALVAPAAPAAAAAAASALDVPPTESPSPTNYRLTEMASDRPAPTSFPSISHSPSSVTTTTPSPPPSLVSAAAAASLAPMAIIPTSLAPPDSSSFCTTPSPSAATPPCPSQVRTYNPTTPSPLSSSNSSSSSPPSSTESSPPVPSTPSVPHWADRDVSRVKENGNNNNVAVVVNNNNVGDIQLSPKAINGDCDQAAATPSKTGCPSPVPSEKDDSKNSLELFNVRLADDVIVLKCSVCNTYTVECRSLSDVSILTKVSNHIMEHVDLMS